jgi:uncharacterized protein
MKLTQIVNNALLLLFALNIFCSCKLETKSEMSLKTHVIRLKPGEDLKKSIQDFINVRKIKAAWMLTCAGSLTQYKIRFANQSEATTGSGHFEIVGLTGTLSENGSHLHIAISDSTGKTIGGHLTEGNLVYTTAEIVIQESSDYNFKRAKDGTTAWEELQIEKLNND